MVASIGRIVHYVSFGSPGGEFPAGYCRPAIVTEIEPVGLCVFNPSGQWFNRDVPHDEKKAAGTWHWPERVD